VKIEIICAGHTPEPHEERWVADYLRRARKYGTVAFTRVKDREPDRTWAEIEKKIHPSAFRVVLDEKGKLLSTEEFSKLFDRAARSGRRSLSFVVGGAYGLPEDARTSADLLLSLTPLTLPHRLALLLLCEQVYRVLSWRAGAPYHHA
jgi:23S rRNA (pseudouridine1915-N3)-methyltransferase